MQNKGAVIFWGIVIVIGIGVATFFGIRAIIRSNTVAPFKQDIDGYLAMNTGNPGGPMIPGGPGLPLKGIGIPGQVPGQIPGKVPGQTVTGKVKGKVITVDVDERAIDYVYFDLPNDLRPTKPDEVGTVALLNWGKVQVATYGTSKPAYQQHVAVKVYDKATKKLIAESFMMGGEPPSSIKSSASSGTGSKPEKEVVDFLVRLPHE